MPIGLVEESGPRAGGGISGETVSAAAHAPMGRRVGERGPLIANLHPGKPRPNFELPCGKGGQPSSLVPSAILLGAPSP